ncbi:MAG: hypothetical protein RL885_17950 [Planctomycetota bacterium]
MTKPAHPNLGQIFRPIVQGIGLVSAELQRAGEQAQAAAKSWSATLEPFTREFKAWLEQLPQWEEEVATKTAQRGWYLDPDMNVVQIREIADALCDETKLEEVERELCDWYTERLPQIELNLKRWYPTRADLIRQAFETHRLELFGASIPLMLAQADGLVYDSTNGQSQLYKWAGKKLGDHLGKWCKEGFKTGFFTAITGKSTLTLDESKRDEAFRHSGLLNRHAVLHGEDTDYATRMNGLRATSLLYFVAWMLHDLMQDDPILARPLAGSANAGK